MAQRYSEHEERGQESHGVGDVASRGAAPRRNEGSDDEYAQRSGRERYRGERDPAMGGSRYRGESRERDWQSPRHGQGAAGDYDDSRGYRMGRGSPEWESQWSEQPYRTGAGGDDVSTYGRQGSLGGGRGAYPGNYQAGQYGSDDLPQRGDVHVYGRSQGGGDDWSSAYRQGRYGSHNESPMYRADPYRGTQRGFRGIGPKNYVRSDERIAEDINETLMDADDIDASQVSVRVKDGVVTLEGTVEQRWIKHRIEDVAEGCSGVRDIENRIRLEPNEAGSERTASPGGTAGGARRGTIPDAARTAARTGGAPTGSPGSGADPARRRISVDAAARSRLCPLPPHRRDPIAKHRTVLQSAHSRRNGFTYVNRLQRQSDGIARI
jgi:osmotically-inducible protein OsmY